MMRKNEKNVKVLTNLQVAFTRLHIQQTMIAVFVTSVFRVYTLNFVVDAFMFPRPSRGAPPLFLGQSGTPKTQLIAHDKEVYDIAFARCTTPTVQCLNK